MGGDMIIHNVGISSRLEDQLMIMNVLSNTLYTDKVAAVLREYGCNAADANVEAGRGDDPIHVRLPSRFDPTIAIRDFGFGMTEEQILNTFIMLGSSTKRSSNEFTGMLGIGSKAGFAYGDSFLVTSFTRGTKTVYNLFRDKGAPKLAKMHEQPTTEPDGIEIKVPVRTEHTQEFVDKARRVFSYFKVPPVLTGANVEWIDRKVGHSGEGWAYTGNRNSVAIMGNVAYKLDAAAMGWSIVSPSYTYGEPSSKESALIGLGVELRFEIGDVDIAANREGLQYSDKTKAAVTRLLRTALSEISKSFSDQLSKCANMWEAKVHYGNQFGRLNDYDDLTLRKLLGRKLMWRGAPIESSQYNLEPSADSIKGTYSVYRRGPRLTRIKGCQHIAAGDETTLIINDLPSGKSSPARLAGWFTNNPICKHAAVFVFPDDASKAAYLKDRELEGAPMTLLSSITPLFSTNAGGATSPHNSKHIAKVFVLDENYFNSMSYNVPRSSWWKQMSADLKKDAGIYVHIDKFKVVTPNSSFPEEPKEFSQKIALLRKAGLLAVPVFGMKSDRLDKLGPKWVKLEDHIAEQMKILAVVVGQELADSLSEQSYIWLMPETALPSIPKKTSLHKLLTEAKRMSNLKTSKELLKLLHNGAAKSWLSSPPLPDPSFSLEDQEALVMKEYPMLSLVPRSRLESGAPHILKNVVDYIRLIESA